MEQAILPRDWAFRPALDVELKHYILLDYLQRVQVRFAEHKLYPHLDDLRAHLDELLRLQKDKNELRRAFHGDLLGFDPKTGEALHESVVQDPQLGVIDEVIGMALPDLHRAWKDGSELKEEIATHIRFAPVGLLPLVTDEGWLFLRTGRDARVYQYRIPLLRTPDVLNGSLHVRTRYVSTFSVGLSRTFEHVKSELLNTFRSFPNPAVFAFETDLSIPHIETFMPLAKQLVYEEVRLRV